jgi:hypothetical protein
MLDCKVCKKSVVRTTGNLVAPTSRIYRTKRPKVFLCGKCYRKTPYSRANSRLIEEADGTCVLEKMSLEERVARKKLARKNPAREAKTHEPVVVPVSAETGNTSRAFKEGDTIYALPLNHRPTTTRDPSRPLDYCWFFVDRHWLPYDRKGTPLQNIRPSWTPCARFLFDGTLVACRDILEGELVTFNPGYETWSLALGIEPFSKSASPVLAASAIESCLANYSEQQAELSNQQGELANQQGELANQQGELANQQGELANQQGELANQQGELANQQGELANQQGELIFQ